ncbi:uncharacterized protein [Cardiocondyla obscurior]|uniref:uncharacterized protein n=1 Tax=Cardiocondyla obscurior TaxID=286306 RepID=UPI0039658AFB
MASGPHSVKLGRGAAPLLLLGGFLNTVVVKRAKARLHSFNHPDETTDIIRIELHLSEYNRKCRRDPLFPNKILWTDESLFTPNEIFNSKNYVLWQHENPHAVRKAFFQFRWSLNVWAGIVDNKIIGPYFLPPRLNGELYAKFLENNLPILLEDVPLIIRQELIYQQDGAPPHFSCRARQVLDNQFADRWIGRGGPIAWPARSPDLNVLDYFIWGHIKTQTENVRDRTLHKVRDANIAAFNTITPDMAHRATQQIVRRAELCLQTQGRHFEQLLR